MSKKTLLALLAVCPLILLAQNSSQPTITVYNQNFAVIRENVPLTLKSGPNEIRFDGITSFLEPDSVILRDPAGQHHLQVLDQNYRSDIASQQALLSAYEGKTIDFLVQNGDKREIVKGKIIRAGVSLNPMLSSLYGVQQYYQPGQNASIAQPIVEVDGRIQFSLPGTPLFRPSATKRSSSPLSSGICNLTSPAPSVPSLAMLPAA